MTMGSMKILVVLGYSTVEYLDSSTYVIMTVYIFCNSVILVIFNLFRFKDGQYTFG